ncbi:MAG: hypothetical protein J5525_12405 [Lachnospiraceae bacterium]|nr:hypothetical protein [Lachnospiraceae bacterium]
MPHSLRVRLGNLRYKKIISDKDYDRLCKALDNEKILDNIRAEIEQRPYGIANNSVIRGMKCKRAEILEIIDKYRGE